MNFVAQKHQNPPDHHLSVTLTPVTGKFAYESAGTAVQGCSAFGGGSRSRHLSSREWWKKTDTSTNIRALCCSHVLLTFFVLAFLAFWFLHFQKLKPLARDRQSKSLTMPCAWRQRLTKIVLLLKIELHDVHWLIIEICLWLASKISLHFTVLRFGGLGIFNFGFHAMPDSSIADQQPRCRASISGWRTAWETSQFSHEKMPCFMSWQERWSWFRRKSAVCLVPWLWIVFAHLAPLFDLN